MDKKYKNFSVRLDEQVHYKLRQISKHEGHSVSRQIRYLVRKCIAEFEKENGTIEISDNNGD